MINEIKDIRPPLEIPNQWMLLWMALALIAIVAIFVWLGIRYFKRAAPTKKTEPMVSMSAWEKAYARLENLRIKKLMERADLKAFYIELSDIVRHYLEERFALRAPEMTTEEFLGSLRLSTLLNDLQKETLKEFLLTCDMVKFAKHQPTVNEAQKSFDLAKTLIDQTHGI